MSVLIKGMNVTWNRCTEDCPFCYDYMYCVADTKERPVSQNGIPSWCPLVEVPPHGDLIDKKTLWEKARRLESTAMEMFLNCNGGDKNRWSYILGERTAFKFDVADSPVVLKGEDDATD